MKGDVIMVDDELKNVVAFWKERFKNGDDVPSSMAWSFHGLITPGMQLGWWNWQDGSRSSFHAPDDCEGEVIGLHNKLETTLFHRSPAQMLLRIRR